MWTVFLKVTWLPKETIPPLPCKECSKSFSESGSLKIHLTLIQEKSHLLLNNFPNHFHKRKSVMPFKDSKNSNLISTLSLLHHFCHCPLLSSNMSLSMFWLLRRWLTTILQRIFEMRKEKLLSCQSHFQIVLSQQLLLWHYFQWLLFVDIIKDILDKIIN